MRILASYERAIAKRPWPAIVAILLVTAFMAYFAVGADSGFDDDDFTPENEVAEANQVVIDEYGSQAASLSVLFVADDNALSRDALLAQLELEDALVSSEVSEILVRTPDSPTGVGAAVDLVVQSAFLHVAYEASQDLWDPNGTNGTNGNSTGGPPEGVLAAVFERAANLSVEERRTILEGGNVTLVVPDVPVPIVLAFDPYSPAMLPGYLATSPFKEVLPFLLSKDYKEGDGTSARMSIFSLSIEEDLEPDDKLGYEGTVADKVEAVEAAHQGLDLRFIGDETTNEEINQASGASIGIIMTLAMVLIVVVLAIVYRSGRDTVFNLVALVFAILWVYGFGNLVGFNFNPQTITVPVLIVALGIDYGIHFTLRYREEVRKGEDIAEAMATSGRTVGFAITLATLTTMLGFMSNVTSDLSSIREFGILAAFGIFSAFVLMMTFFPAVKAVSDGRRLARGKPIMPEPREDRRSLWGWARRAPPVGEGETCPVVCSSGVGALNNLLGTGAVIARRPLAVLAVVALVTGLSLYGAAQLESRYSFRDFLPEGLEVSESLELLTDEFDFSRESAYILAEGDVADPEVFLAIDGVQTAALSSGTAVLTDPVESPLELARTKASPQSPRYDPEFAALWEEQVDSDGDGDPDAGIGRSNVTAVYDWLYERDPDQASRVLHRDGSAYDGLVIRVPVNSRGGEAGVELAEDMEAAAAPMEALEGGSLDRVIATGGPIVSQTVSDSISEGQLRSVVLITIISLAILTGLYFHIHRSLALGALTLMPLLLVIAWGFGGMWALGIPFNPVTVTIAAITVGLGIDYAVHVTQRFMEDSSYLDDSDCALCVSVSHTGTALFGSAATTVAGFGLLSLSILPPLAQFGTVTAINIALAFVASVFVLPTLLIVWYNWRRRRQRVSARTAEDASEGAPS